MRCERDFCRTCMDSHPCGGIPSVSELASLLAVALGLVVAAMMLGGFVMRLLGA